MKRNKYTEQQRNWFVENAKGRNSKEIIYLFDKEFNILLTKSKVENLKTKLKVKSGTVGGRFKKGQEAWNKGKKWDEYMSKAKQKKSLETTFQKGYIPPNIKRVGSERISKDGYIEVKIYEPKKWMPKHRVVYEEHFGKIPKGRKVVFLDGDRKNCNIENLELVESSELLIINKNGLYFKDRELTKSGLLIAKIKNNINRKQKEINDDYKK